MHFGLKILIYIAVALTIMATYTYVLGRKGKSLSDSNGDKGFGAMACSTFWPIAIAVGLVILLVWGATTILKKIEDTGKQHIANKADKARKKKEEPEPTVNSMINKL